MIKTNESPSEVQKKIICLICTLPPEMKVIVKEEFDKVQKEMNDRVSEKIFKELLKGGYVKDE